MNIVQIPRRFTRSRWGGTETVVLETCRRLLARGHETEILTTRALDDTAYDHVEGVPVERTSYFYPYLGLDQEARHRLDLKAGNLFSFELLQRLWNRQSADLIHLHTGKRLGAIGRFVAQRRGIPYVVSLHGGCHEVPEDERASWTEPTQGALEWGKVLGWWFGSRQVLAEADAILCLSQTEARQVAAELPHQRIEVLPNGVDCHHFASGNGARFRRLWDIPAEREVLLTVGRIDAQKNQLQALEVLSGLLAKGHDAHLVLIGPCTDPSYQAQLAARLEASGLTTRVTLTGGISSASRELVDAYHAADLFLLPSRHEPFGIVILEAWAAGLPVVATSVGGIPEILTSPDLGSLYPAGAPDLAVTACSELLTDSYRRGLIEARASEKVRETYDWESITTRLETIYASVRKAKGEARGKQGRAA